MLSLRSSTVVLVTSLVLFAKMEKGQGSSSYCPGSPAWTHAKCDMTVTFPSTPCSVIREEISLRVEGSNGWVDPHNAGTYSSSNTSSDPSVLAGSRLTGDGKYTDQWQLTFASSGEGCVVRACSESQVTSVLDFSTNYCNLRSLYCNKSKDGCPIVKHDLVDYKEAYHDCWQRKAANCIATGSEKGN